MSKIVEPRHLRIPVSRTSVDLYICEGGFQVQYGPHSSNVVSWQELQTALGDYATVTPKPKPRPAQAEVAVTGTERSAALLRRRAGSKGGIE
jgi:hypothetical protein